MNLINMKIKNGLLMTPYDVLVNLMTYSEHFIILKWIYQKRLVVIQQSIIRRYLARRRVERIRLKRIKALFQLDILLAPPRSLIKTFVGGQVYRDLYEKYESNFHN